MNSAPERCDLNNLLFRTSRAAVRCDVASASTATVVIKARRLTQVSGQTFLDAAVTDANLKSLAVRMTCGESVLAVKTGLVQVAGPQGWPLDRANVAFLLPERGNPTIMPPDVRMAIGFDFGLNSVVAMQDSQVRAEALLIATPLFRGEIQDRNGPDSACELLDYEGPKLSQQLPGVDASRLPVSK